MWGLGGPGSDNADSVTAAPRYCYRLGAHLVNAAAGGVCELFYWRESHRDVDFVVRAGRTVLPIELKSGRAPDAFPGLGAFATAFTPKRALIVDGDGISLEDFLTQPVEHWLQA